MEISDYAPLGSEGRLLINNTGACCMSAPDQPISTSLTRGYAAALPQAALSSGSHLSSCQSQRNHAQV
jgi:hypothetical protein